MKRSILIDTCSFVDYLRDGVDAVVPTLVISGSALLSRVVRIELLKGARKSDRRALATLFEGLHQLEDFAPAELVEKTLFQLHGRGINLGFPDLMILSDAIRSRAILHTSDKQLGKAAEMLKVKLLA